MAYAYIDSKDAHIWWNKETKQVLVCSFGDMPKRPSADHGWCDVGACYAYWRKLSEDERLLWLREYVLDIHVWAGIPVETIIREFAKIRQFYALGRDSHMMCRVLTKTLLGTSLELESASFDELMSAPA